MAWKPTANRWRRSCVIITAKVFPPASSKWKSCSIPRRSNPSRSEGPAAAPMLIIDNVTVRIAGRVILDGANGAISDGRKAGLIGRNGAGKTTLLKLILGQHESETGKI